MKKRLLEDYLERSEKRVKALHFFEELNDFPDVIREAQETVELLLKALLLSVGVDILKIHDVGKYIAQYGDLFSEGILDNLPEIQKISRELRKDRELAFYGMDDWIPLNEYTREDASQAIGWVEFILQLVKKEIAGSEKEN
ncbi:MAG: HEPN domain-containing protein [Candidatus Atribacteria bacterium]|nr:HEPN domain-containing protein [Candidatus Atribacteria bacterium]